jgi:hypothetical protein
MAWATRGSRKHCSASFTPRDTALVCEYIRGCSVCQCNKTEHMHRVGLLCSLDVPNSIWMDIAMDFVEGFPKVGGKCVTLTVVNRLSKYAHFVSLGHPYSATSAAKAFFNQVVRLHRIPASIVSDRDLVFTSKLWQELFKLSGTKLCLSFAFRPQTDGQSELTNKIITVYLHCMAGDRPRSWLRWLPWAEYCYNTSFQSVLKETPFRVVYGHAPPPLIPFQAGAARVVAVDRQLKERDEFLTEIKDRLRQAQELMKASHDSKHRPLEFQVGQWVWLRLNSHTAIAIKDGAPSKLQPKYYGPYEVIEKVGTLAYCLRLPSKARIHDVFHVVFLKQFDGSPPMAVPSLPPIVHGCAIPQPDQVVCARPTKLWELLVRWQGGSAVEATCEELDKFKEDYPAFQLEDNLFHSAGGSVVDAFFGKTYSRRKGKSQQSGAEHDSTYFSG